MTSSVETTPVLEKLTKRNAWKKLQTHYKKIHEVHLRNLFTDDPQCGERMTAEAAGIFLDYSKNRVTDETLKLLVKLAAESRLRSDRRNVSRRQDQRHGEARSPDTPAGKNLHYGIREHAMGAIVNGLSLSRLRAFGATFFIFSDYARPAIRLAALMELPAIFIFTRDAMGDGEDGPTHQPVEHLAHCAPFPAW
jgi:transketolase